MALIGVQQNTSSSAPSSGVTSFNSRTGAVTFVDSDIPLTSAHLLVGNGSNIAVDVAASGDLTLANTGAFTIANNAVTTAKINNNAVTYAKIQAVSTTSKLLGSSSTTTPVQEITIGTGLSLSGTTLTATAVSAPVYAVNEIPFGDGVTAGGVTNPFFIYDTAGVFNVTWATNGTTFNATDGNKTFTFDTGGNTYFKIDGVADEITFPRAAATFTIANLGGNGSGYVAVDNNGLLSYAASAAATLTDSQVGYGDPSNLMTSTSSFTWTNATKTLAWGDIAGAINFLSFIGGANDGFKIYSAQTNNRFLHLDYNGVGPTVTFYAGDIDGATGNHGYLRVSGNDAQLTFQSNTSKFIDLNPAFQRIGDIDGLVNITYLEVNSNNQAVSILNGTDIHFLSDSSSDSYFFGKTNGLLVSNIGLKMGATDGLLSALGYGLLYDSIATTVTIGTLAGGSGTTFLVDDTAETYVANKLGGSGNQIVTVDNAGVLGVSGAIPVGTNYNPTLGGGTTTNVTSSTAKNCTYTRVGNVVTVFGSLGIVTTLAIATILEISLPIPSNIGSVTDLNGTANASSAIGTNGYIEGVVANDTAALKMIALSVAGSGNVFFSFSYTVI